MPSPTHGVVVPFRQSPLGSVIADDADAIQNPNNPMPNGNGAPLGAVDGTATDDSPLVPPLPPPRSEPESSTFACIHRQIILPFRMLIVS
ncbi:hypothetical protein FS842_001405 [Serendipita sp. 407]|nr:hypothetical protein FS842_001405 [Serendipita sp. 407]